MLQKTKSITKFVAAAALVIGVTAAQAQWAQVHFDGSNNANTGTSAAITDLSTGPFWTTGAQGLTSYCRPIVADGKIFVVAVESSTTDRLWIKSFDPSTGALVDESADLDVGDASIYGNSYLGGDNTSVNLGTTSAPTVDAANHALYFATGATMYRLSTTDLGETWSTVISSSNTDAGSTFGVINSSPATGAGKVYIKTYPITFGALDESQVVAFDDSTGAVTWYANSGGRGTSSPLFVDLGGSQIVVVEHQTTGSNVELQAFDANSTGAASPVWTISTPLAEPSSAPFGAGYHGQWGDSMGSGGKIYGLTSNFGGGRLYRVDAATGNLDWQVDTDGSEVPPVLIDGKLYVINTANRIARFDPATGNADGNPVVVIATSEFRDYVAATADGIYFAKAGQGLRFFTLGTTDAVVLGSTSPATAYSGPCSVDASTGFVYTHDGSGGLAAFTGAATVADWMKFE